ncbi:aspartate--tRNA ligase [Candidatus Gracilibacteria bacterium]|nr:MAG: aspartate--tRNA ligase [Candidatus Gracilibacteria bacterium]
MLRTHTAGELTAKNIGDTVTLSGWVANRRDHGGLIFIDLRDRYGLTQTVFDPSEDKEAWEVADTFRSEYVVQLTGKVRSRPEGQENKDLITGEIEVIISNAKILSKSEVPPFEVSEHSDANEDIRLKYRYLDLRRKNTFDTIAFRSKMNAFTRDWFIENDFLEVQTPLFTVSSPEGARDYLIPSRIHHGKFYALPQAPQQYKQLLMVGGVDKYFQIAPCFRDEDPRADRHSCEFYQIDAEMSFVDQDDVFEVAEKFSKDLIENLSDKKIVHLDGDKFKRLTYKEAMDLYGSDKPDIRFDMHFEDFTDTFKDSGFSLFANTVAQGGVVKAMKLEGVEISRKQIDELTEVARSLGAGGLAYIIYDKEGPRSPILKFFNETELNDLMQKLAPKEGDVIFFGAGDYKTTCKVLGGVRVECRDKFDLVDSNEIGFCWVTDFPMYELKDDGTYDFEHNPFSMPHGGASAFEGDIDPLEIHGAQYDLACNGYEVLSGSIRNHDINALVKAFEIVGKGEEEVKEKFGAMYTAFKYGVPPHGGFAFGFDRLMMILKDETNIREIYAFPKSGKAEDVMMNAPASVDEMQLRELHIKVRETNNK